MSKLANSPNPLQDLVIQGVSQQVVLGHGDEQGLAKQHGAGGAAGVLGLPLPEVHGQVHLVTVLLLHLIPAVHTDTRRGRVT